MASASALERCELEAFEPLGAHGLWGTGRRSSAKASNLWNDALAKGRGRGPIPHLKTLRNRLGWTPQPAGWHSDGQYLGLSTQTFRHLKKCSNKRDDRTRSAVNRALGGVWHVRTHSAFTVAMGTSVSGARKNRQTWNTSSSGARTGTRKDGKCNYRRTTTLYLIVSNSMDCFLRHGYWRYSPMNRSWFTGLELELSGLTAQAATAATLSTEGVVLDTTLTLKRESGSPPRLEAVRLSGGVLCGCVCSRRMPTA
eukprot:2687881-Amphidinium_carterae.1